MLQKTYEVLSVKNLFLLFFLIILNASTVNAAQNKITYNKLTKENKLMNKNNHWHIYESPYSVNETMNIIANILKEKDINIFSRIKFSEDAKKAGLTMPDEELIVFGNPKAGTLLMQEDPTIGFELPLKILAWTSKGGTKVGYIQPSIMAKQYAIDKSQMILNNMDQLLQNIVTTAISKN